MSSARLRLLISRAENGDTRSLRNLCQELTPQNFTIEAVSVILKHLDIDLVPNMVTGEHSLEPHKTYADRALPCLTLLTNIATACGMLPSFKTAVVPQVVRAIDGICLWTNFCLHFGLSYPERPALEEDFRKAYFAHSLTLINLIEVDPEVSQALFSSDIFVSLVIRFWVTEGKNGKEFMSLEGEYVCPILHLMLVAVQNKGFAQLFAQRTTSRGRPLPDEFARSLISRTRQLVQSQVSPSDYIRYMEKLGRLTRKAWSASPELQKSLVKVKYMRELGRALYFVLAQVQTKSTSSKELMKEIFVTAARLVEPGVNNRLRGPHTWRDLVTGNVHGVLLWLIAQGASEVGIEVSKDTFKAMAPYTVFPCVLKQLEAARIPEGVKAKLEEDERFKDFWLDFCDMLRTRGEIFREMPEGFSICDNLRCRRDRLAEEAPVKQCSHCHTVTYCSERCQKEDWVRYHRSECRAGSIHHTRQRADGISYTHAIRRFHVYLVQWVYNAGCQETRDTFASSWPTLGLNEWYILIQTKYIQFVALPQPLSLLPEGSPDYRPEHGREEVWWERDFMDPFNQPYLKPRVKDLVLGLKCGTLKETLLIGKGEGKGGDEGEVAVAEGVFHMGSDVTVFLTVPLTRANPSAKWEAGHGVARHAFRKDIPKSNLQVE